jgi:hypothetical protein
MVAMNSSRKSQDRNLILLNAFENETDGPTEPPQNKVFSFTMLGLPALSLLFPQLLHMAKSLPPNSSEQFAVVTALFVSNRVYLYALSATIVGLAAMRGASDSPKLGKRVIDLTEELLYRPAFEKQNILSLPNDGEKVGKKEEKPEMIASLSKSGFGDSLDQVSPETQAFFLPLLVSLLLATSIFLLPFFNDGATEIDQGTVAFLIPFQDMISQVLPQISQLWNIALLTMFTRSEVRRLGSELEVTDIQSHDRDDSTVILLAEWTVVIGIMTCAFFLQQWPAQNFVNMALAVLVARVIQLDKFSAIIGALSLLTLYDATSVFLIPAVNAVDSIPLPDLGACSLTLADATAPTTAAGSAMGSVAIQKLTSGTFQPGLLTTKVGNSLGGSLGLGDAVFPSILATFVRRFDLKQDSDQKRTSLFTVSMVGYLLGCFACEFAPMLSSSGIPALVFIIPAMVGLILVSSSTSGELESLFQFDPSMDQSFHESKE